MKVLTPSKIMRENWKFDFIKDLEDGEECKEMTDFSGYYITNRGRVFSMRTYSWLTPTNFNSYYYNVGLGKKVGKVVLHTLVGRHFLHDWKPGLDVCHYDEELSFPQINWVENLWSGTRSENLKDSYDKGRH